MNPDALHGLLLHLRSLPTGGSVRPPLDPAAEPYVKLAQQGIGALRELLMAKVDVQMALLPDPQDRLALHLLAKWAGLDQPRELIDGTARGCGQLIALVRPDATPAAGRRAVNRAIVERAVPLLAEALGGAFETPAQGRPVKDLRLPELGDVSDARFRDATPVDMEIALEALTKAPAPGDRRQRKRVRTRAVGAVLYRAGQPVDDLPPRIRRHRLTTTGMDTPTADALRAGFRIERLDEDDLERLLNAARGFLQQDVHLETAESALGVLLLQFRMRRMDLSSGRREPRRLRRLRSATLVLASEYGRRREDGRFWPATQILLETVTHFDARMTAARDGAVIASGLCVPACGLRTLERAEVLRRAFNDSPEDAIRWRRRLKIARAGIHVRAAMEYLAHGQAHQASRELDLAREATSEALSATDGMPEWAERAWAQLRVVEIGTLRSRLPRALASDRGHAEQLARRALDGLLRLEDATFAHVVRKAAFEFAAFRRDRDAVAEHFTALVADPALLVRHPRWNLLVRLVAEAAHTWPDPLDLPATGLPDLPAGFVGYRLRTQIPVLCNGDLRRGAGGAPCELWPAAVAANARTIP